MGHAMGEVKCHCWQCRRDIPVSVNFPGITEGMARMFLCPRCGNKRCPRATDHREPCSGSNDPGQLGSRYGVWSNPNRPLLDFVEGKSQDDR